MNFKKFLNEQLTAKPRGWILPNSKFVEIGKIISEKFVTSNTQGLAFTKGQTYVELYVNPSENERKGADRAVIIPNGDFYIINESEGVLADIIIHEDILTTMMIKKILPKERLGGQFDNFLNKFLTVTLNDNGIWVPGESYNNYGNVKLFAIDYMKTAKVKNPSLNFKPSR
jgi:hypothetical protein